MIKTHKSVIDMIANSGLNSGQVKSAVNTVVSRALSRVLTVLRNENGLTQSAVAKNAGVTQSKISKLEVTPDDEIKIGDLKKYCQSIGVSVNISLMKNNHTTDVDRVKMHWFAIDRLLKKMRGHGKKDPKIALGVADFHAEALSVINGSLFAALNDAVENASKTVTDNFSVSVIENENVSEYSKQPTSGKQTEKELVH